MIQCRSHDSPVNVEEVGLDRNEGLNWRFALAVVGLCFVYKLDMADNDPQASPSEAIHFGFAWDIAMAVAPRVARPIRRGPEIYSPGTLRRALNRVNLRIPKPLASRSR